MIAPTSGSASLNKIPSPRLLATPPHQRLTPLLQRTQAQVVAVEAQKVEGHERGLDAAALGQERVEVAASVVLEDDRLAIDHRLVRREAAHRLRDPGKAVREVGAASAPDQDALALFAGQDAKAVVLDLVQPAGSGGRAIGERGLARANEADREISSPTGRGSAPDYGP
jgi:hypothetical protein